MEILSYLPRTQKIVIPWSLKKLFYINSTILSRLKMMGMKLIYSIFLVWSNAGVTLNYSKLSATTFCNLLRCKTGLIGW